MRWGGQDKLMTRDISHVRKDARLHCIRIWAVSLGSSPHHQVSLLALNSLSLVVSMRFHLQAAKKREGGGAGCGENMECKSYP